MEPSRPARFRYCLGAHRSLPFRGALRARVNPKNVKCFLRATGWRDFFTSVTVRFTGYCSPITASAGRLHDAAQLAVGDLQVVIHHLEAEFAGALKFAGGVMQPAPIVLVSSPRSSSRSCNVSNDGGRMKISTKPLRIGSSAGNPAHTREPAQPRHVDVHDDAMSFGEGIDNGA